MELEDFLLLRTGEAEGLVSPAEALEAIEEAWRDDALSEPRALTLATPEARFRVEGAALPDLAGFRLLSEGTESRDWLFLSNAQGRPLALIEARWLQALRTATTAALAAKLLARPGITTAALIGAGRIAGHLPAVLALALPDLKELHVAARRPEAVAEFCAAYDGALKLLPAAGPAEAAAQADLVITLSSADVPLVHAGDLRRGATVVALGGADVAPDVVTSWAQYVAADDAVGLVPPPDGLLARGAARRTPEENVLALVQGVAAGDVALAAIAWRKARLRRLGLRFALGESATQRPRGPTPRRMRTLMR